MEKLEHTHSITEKRSFGKVVTSQEMVVQVDFDYSDNSFNVTAVNIYENGKLVAEISTLLDCAKGSPLDCIVNAIDWRKIYMDKAAYSF